jgi:hypothetical protein
MSISQRARATSRPIPWNLVIGLLVLVAAIVAGLGDHSLASSASSDAPPIPSSTGTPPSEVGGIEPGAALGGALGGALGEADGVVPAGTTVFDDGVAGVAKLDPALLRALRRAATDAEEDGVEFVVNSGWRSAAYQEQLLREAVAKYGSEAKAARWVGTPTTSAHVSGDAVDLGPSAATTWLAEHGARYGLCRIYRNEPWHFELRPDAADRGCPRMFADPTGDPRMWP